MSKEFKNYVGLILLLLLVILVWRGLWYGFEHWWGPENRKDIGAFGDSFGTINSLFSALAFAGIIYTIILQRNELSLQRQELIETRKELKRSADAQDRSEKQLERQSNNLKTTARLNALNSLLNYYIEIEKISEFVSEIIEAKKKQKDCVEEIQNILNRKNEPI
ncbi:hypothetical protein EZV76_04895 [Flagellimonas alvinocaridis]|uniref:Uncharacterized protein n=1 Tax=Flagellimonas alvinocaridis TaxID=2530200 RepID=A0A4S8S1Q4_9FLAO|nr:hypothetical protein [Allomuricauda alvinocaridis]THV61674.1 hypothetical protein EZV76_04895 [Allomuricauda alvinocaridis]